MENQKAKYDILLEQMQLPESIKNTPLLKSGQLKQVLVHTESRKWTFQLLFAEILPIDLYQIFLQNLTLAFQQIATVELQIEATNHAYDGTQLVEYWQFINENQPFATPFIQQVVKDCIPTVANDQVTIKVANESAISLVMQQYFPTLAQLFQQAGFPKLRFVAEFDQTQALQDLEAHEERKKNQQEIFMKQAAEAVALHEQRAKAAEKDGPAYDGPIALGRAIPKEELITPMGNILEEERRITIEGYIFDKEVRELRSKRKILILKITDYTSSFIVKKFSSGEKDEQIFDAIQTGKWLKVRGSIQEDTFMRDLVMNAQDLVEVTHAQRVDRAPEDQKRVELHVHSNMSQMDATNKIGDFVAQAAKWGHKAIAITDHGGAQSFPDAHQAAKKAGIKMIYGVEANIVDDGVQVAYNPKPTPLADATYVVFDVETTGLSAVYDTIIELAAVKMHKGNVEASFDEFIDPGHPLSNTTINLTGITDEMVRGSKSEEEVLRLFREFSEGAVLVAHNASFDMGFLNTSYRKYGIPEAENPVIDTLELARYLYPEFKRFGLGVLSKKFGVSLEQHHRAIYDAEATGHLAWIFVKEAMEHHKMFLHDDLNRHVGGENSYRAARPFHATILVQTQKGLKNLFKLISMSNVTYFHDKVPRIPRSELVKLREGLIVGSGCDKGEVFVAMMQKGVEAAKKLAEFYDYIEIMPKPVYAPLIEQELIKNTKLIWKKLLLT